MSQLTDVFKPIAFCLVLFLSYGCGGNKVETTQIDCQLNDISIEHDLVGTVSTIDIVTGSITIKCDGAPVVGASISGSSGWWNLVSVGPSDSNGVISVSRPAESIGHSDIGTLKQVVIVVHAFEGNKEKSRNFSISIPIS